MDHVLAFDTSMNGCCVGVTRASGEVVTCAEQMARGQSERLVPMIEDALSQANISFKDLSLIVTTIGPGAFTGLRIGLSTAKSLALALDIPLIGLCTLEVLARQHGQACAVITETKREDFYFQRFGANTEPLCNPQALSSADIVAILGDEEIDIVGDANQRFIQGAKTDGFTPYDIMLPDPATMIKIGQERADLNNEEKIEPLYLRGPDVSKPKNPPRVLVQNEQ